MFFYSLSIFGQSYHPLIRPNLVWQIFYGDNLQPCFFYGGDNCYFDGDSTILGFTYKTISYNPIFQLFPGGPGGFCPPYAVYNNITNLDAFLIREDTIAKKVFIYNKTTSSDDLFYDFNLVAGDTLKSTYASQGGILVVDSVSTIALFNGQIRKIFYLNNNQYYVESIGGTQGLQYPIIVGANNFNSIGCISENNIPIWGGLCVGTVGISENQLASKVILPNPFGDILNITMTNTGSYEVFLYNSFSMEILNKSFHESTSINTEHLISGVYFYKLINKNGLVLSGKLVKH